MKSTLLTAITAVILTATTHAALPNPKVTGKPLVILDTTKAPLREPNPLDTRVTITQKDATIVTPSNAVLTKADVDAADIIVLGSSSMIPLDYKIERPAWQALLSSPDKGIIVLFNSSKLNFLLSNPDNTDHFVSHERQKPQNKSDLLEQQNQPNKPAALKIPSTGHVPTPQDNVKINMLIAQWIKSAQKN